MIVCMRVYQNKSQKKSLFLFSLFPLTRPPHDTNKTDIRVLFSTQLATGDMYRNYFRVSICIVACVVTRCLFHILYQAHLSQALQT